MEPTGPTRDESPFSVRFQDKQDDLAARCSHCACSLGSDCGFHPTSHLDQLSCGSRTMLGGSAFGQWSLGSADIWSWLQAQEEAEARREASPGAGGAAGRREVRQLGRLLPHLTGTPLMTVPTPTANACPSPRA